MFHHVSTSNAPYWPSTTKYQPVPPSTDPVPSSTNQYCPVLTQHHHISTSTILHWPSTTKYQPVPPSTDPVPSYINQYRFILTQYHQVSTSTNLYCFCLGTTDSCTVYPGSCYQLTTQWSFIWVWMNMYFNISPSVDGNSFLSFHVHGLLVTIVFNGVWIELW